MDHSPFHDLLGARVERLGEGIARAIVEIGPHHRNQRGVVHGGVYSATLDAAMGTAVVSAIPAEAWCATTSLTVQFLDGATEGELRARGEVVRRGRAIAFVKGQLTDGHGRLLAVAQGTWHLWDRRPVAPGSEGSAYVTLRASGERLRVGKIVAVGRNYADHVREMGNAPTAPPVLFLKPASALVHDGEAIVLPRGAGEVHHEVELVAVIGRAAKRVPAERAAEHVLAYGVGLDMTLRDAQAAAKSKGEPWAVSKGFDTSAAISSVVPAAEVGDGAGLAIALEVNGEVRQQASTSAMLRGVAELVEYASSAMRLERGDLLFTGTPAGVGPVRPGDRLEARIDRIGALRVRVEAEPE